jgi:hypothetical protein
MRVGFSIKNVALFRQSPLQSSEPVVKSGIASSSPTYQLRVRFGD